MDLPDLCLSQVNIPVLAFLDHHTYIYPGFLRSVSYDKNAERENSAGQEGSGIRDKRNEESLALVNIVKQVEPNNEVGGSSMDESSLDPIGGKNSSSFQSLETIPEESRLISSELVDIAVQHSSIGARVLQRKQKAFKRKSKLGKEPVSEKMAVDFDLVTADKISPLLKI
ncbi:glutamate--tRNA ligase 1 [Striga asiatica]|uniref:Glutamate--tRNA ligase 1 n=1 Tax=Striga asiatica TaxID=4170 RepID=A0A5A7PWV4_STRAF|nr:glutamate--tRNA ligase 1 [Striga asiatica]